MKITLHQINICELVNGFENNEEEGVVGYGGRLNIRPKYQREFVYSESQQQEVINSIFKGFPLNVMYWVKNEDGTFELLDGQQRTLSICSYFVGEYFSNVNGNLRGFDNLAADEKETFLEYPLQIYICEDGTDSEKIDWFKIINIAGERLTNQEMLNAVYSGEWVTALKRRFSKSNCVAYQMGSKYLTGEPIRQAYLETTLKWISRGNVERYMAEHQHDKDCDAEWQYFQDVINWVKKLFPNYRTFMKGVAWGDLYNEHGRRTDLKASQLEERICKLVEDDDVRNQRGIFAYLLTGDERTLNLRAFSDNQKQKAYQQQKGYCAICHNHFDIKEMEADHITPWSQGGHTVQENCQMLCRPCNRRKSNK